MFSMAEVQCVQQGAPRCCTCSSCTRCAALSIAIAALSNRIAVRAWNDARQLVNIYFRSQQLSIAILTVAQAQRLLECESYHICFGLEQGSTVLL
jgi:hypothetical protein